MIALTATALFTPLEWIDDPIVILEGDTIVQLGARANITVPSGARLIEFKDAMLAPGLVDIHIHGGAGHDVMEANSDALPAVERLLFRHGVTAYLPTTVTAPVDFTLAALERLANAIEASTYGTDRARPLGIHLEGPFLSHARRGVHRPEDLQPPSIALFNRFWQAARGHIKMLTIAPELDCATELISEAARRGVCVSLGHSDADFRAAHAGVAAGARHVTHTFNAMRPLSHREPGILELALTEDSLTADIIADGVHLHPAVVKLFLRAKGVERAVLITDALAATGMPDGQYRIGEFEFELKDGHCLSGKTLAGSVLTLDRAIANVMKFAALDFQQALRTATLNPASTATLPCARGKLAAGGAADIVVFNRSYQPVRTIVGGVVSYTLENP